MCMVGVLDWVKLHGFQYQVDDWGEMGVFEYVDLGGQRIWGVFFFDGAPGLEDDFTLVVVFVDIMNGDTALFVAGCNDGLVNLGAVHVLATIAGQQRGVDVDDALGEGLDERGGEEPQETGQDDQVNFFVEHELCNDFGLVKVGAAEYFGWDV
jgi:hypothetical protein